MGGPGVAFRGEFLGGALMAAVEFRNVCFRIGGNLILDNLSFRIEAGETLVLLGRSG